MNWVRCPQIISPGSLSLYGPEVHVWKVELDHSAGHLEQHWNILSADEQAKANGFHFEIHRSQFVAGRALLRILVSCYLQIQPQLLVFEYGLYGKPTLIPEQSQGGIQFNLTHSDALVLYAFTAAREIGIDIERVQLVPDMDQVAARSFSRLEYKTWAKLPDSEKGKAFFRCWTRKEAFVKAIGNGIQYPLDKFDVTLLPGHLPKLTRVESDPLAVDRWSYMDLPEIPGYASALISEGHDWCLECYEYQD